MPNMDMPMDYHVRCYAGTQSKTHAKAGQNHAELKAVLSTIQNDLLHEFINKLTVTFCIIFGSCVAATGQQ